MKPLNLFKYIIFIMLIALILSCRKNPAIYQMPNDPRAYTWTVDTLKYYNKYNFMEGVLLNRLWGSSSNDVYAIGPSSDLWHQMYHYDGEKWSVVKEVRSVDHSYDGLYNIFGFNKNDVWAVGDLDYGIGDDRRMGNSIIHFDGTGWHKVYTSDLDSMYRGLYSIWGASPDDIWFGGCWGDMYHWDGTTVTKDTMPFDIKNYIGENGTIDEFHSIAGYPGKGTYAVFLGARGYDDIDYLMQHTDKGWVFRDSLNSYVDLWMSPSGRLYVANFWGVYEWNGTGLTPLFTDICAWAVFDAICRE